MRLTELIVIILALIPLLGLILAACNGVPIRPDTWPVILSLAGVVLGAVVVWLRQRRGRT